MNTLPKALLLADALDKTADFQMRAIEAAAELRRLHEVNQMLVESAEMALEALEELRFANAPFLDEAMEALRQALSKAKEQA